MAASPEDNPPQEPEIHSLASRDRIETWDRSDNMSLIAVASVLLRHPRLMVWIPLVFTALAILAARARGLEYTSQSQFEPRSSETGVSPFQGLASQFGINLSSLTGGQGIEFYAKVLESRELLRKAVEKEYVFSGRALGEETGDTLRGTLIDLFNIRGEIHESRLFAAVRNLDRRVSVRSDLRAGLVVVSTTAPWPELAVQINRTLLQLLNDFNLETRQSQAGAERSFVEERLEENKAAYDEAESELLLFHQVNRRYVDSPELVLEEQQLQRRVTHQQQLYTTLQQLYERARIDEVRNTPIITVVEPPEANVQRTGGLVLFALLGLILGGMIAVGAAFLSDHLGRQRTLYPDEYVEFRSLRRDAPRKLLPRRLVRRRTT